MQDLRNPNTDVRAIAPSVEAVKRNGRKELLFIGVDRRAELLKVIVERSVAAMEAAMPMEIYHIKNPTPEAKYGTAATQFVLQQPQPEVHEQPTVMDYPQQQVMTQPAAYYDQSAKVNDAAQKVEDSYTNQNQTKYHEYLQEHPRQEVIQAVTDNDSLAAIGYGPLDEQSQRDFRLAG